MQNNDISKTFREVAPYLGLGTQLAATIVLFLFIGTEIDEYYNSKPLYTIILATIGIFVGLYTVIKTILSLEKKKKNESDKAEK